MRSISKRLSACVDKLSGNVEPLSANVQGLSGKTDRIADGLIGLTSIVGQRASAQERTDVQLRATSRQLEETGKRLEETDAGLTGHIRAVESHLDQLITMFERHLGEDHGPRPS